MTEPKHPEVTVQLSEMDGNVFSIIGRTDAAMGRARVPHDERKAYREEVMNAKSYDEALQITMRWVAWS